MNLPCRLGSSLLLLFLLCPAFATEDPADEARLVEQRKQYNAAKKFLQAGHLQSFNKTTAGLKDYPLYPYLRYDYLRRRLWKVEEADIIAFLDQYADLPMANDLRRSWLRLLVKRSRWQTFIDNYTPQQDKTLQCNQLQARIHTGKQAYLLEDTRSIWLAGESLPPECDSAFALLYKSELMNDELVWQRIRLAMENRQKGLASFLSRKLSPAKQKWAERWIATYDNPSRYTHKPAYDDVPEAREILLYGMHQLARQNINSALSRWQQIKPAYGFAQAEIDKLERELAVRAARKNHKQAKQLLDNIAPAEVDDLILYLRLSTALADEDWPILIKWTEGEPADANLRLRWFYWRARALQQNGDKAGAMKIYSWLAQERDYYGFLAADRIGAPYKMNHRPPPDDAEEWQKISGIPAITRARELYLLGSHYSARREWHHSLKQLTSYQKQIAAAIAADWGWHDRAILTLAMAELYDDLATRFPMPYTATMEQFAKMRKLDIGWLYALTRAESAFIEDVRSPAGALGLMQVMPATGQQTAKRIGLKNYHTKQLLQSNKNVRIGSAYLKQMYASFNRNMVLATAAYNAGPSNVKRWLPKQHCEEADIWIEKIPFTETRKYVQRILFFSSVYDWRLQRDIVPIAKRVSLVQPHKQILASQHCPVGKV